MFGIPSFNKIGVLVAIIIAVWYGFKLIGQIERQRRELAKRAGEAAKSRASTVEDTVKCPVCDIFVARAGASSCGRADCPY